MQDRREAERRVAGIFDAVAPDYDASGVSFFQPIADGLVAALEPRRGETWLDLGCGRGAVTFPLAAAVDPGQVCALDVSPAMLALAAARAREQGIANVRFVEGSAQDPDPALGTFDGIASSLVLFFLPSPEDALRSWQPLLAPGGRIGVTTFGETDARWKDVDAVLQPYLPRNDARTSGSEGPFGSDAGMERLLERAGYDEVRTVTQQVDVVFRGVDQWRAFSMSTGQRAAWLAVPEDERADVRTEAERRLAAHARPDGSVVFVQQVRHTLGRRPAGGD